jgi:hypothetical protein
MLVDAWGDVSGNGSLYRFCRRLRICYTNGQGIISIKVSTLHFGSPIGPVRTTSIAEFEETHF